MMPALAARVERLDEVRSDESGSAGDDDVHGVAPTVRGRRAPTLRRDERARAARRRTAARSPPSTAAARDVVDRQAFAPQHDRHCRPAPREHRSGRRSSCPSTRGPRCATRLPQHEHRRAVRRVARIAVGIAAGDDADAVRPRRRVGARRSRPRRCALQLLHGDDLRAQASSPAARPSMSALSYGERRRAVQHDARAHDVAADLVVADARRGIGDASADTAGRGTRSSKTRQRLRQSPSSSSARARCVIRRSAATDGACVEPLADVARRRAARKPSRFMPVLTLTNTSSGRAGPRFSSIATARRRARRWRALRGDLVQFARLEEAFEQQDAARVARRRASSTRGVELDQREPVGVVERRQHALESVPVGIGLDDRQHLRARRVGADAREIGRAARRG